ncbi:MAG: nucleotidyltransferase family protein [Bacteroidota bacterium]|nr:nucleotidyltransferase family protein [Bacteroidota bacterium]
MKAMIFAAGLGTRLQPLTNNTPKALVELHGKPMLGHLIHKLARYGITDFVVNVHHFSEQVESYLATPEFDGYAIRISDEREQLLDTGGGLVKARNLLQDNEPVLVHNVDVWHDINIPFLLDYHQTRSSLATLAVSKRKTSRYLLFDKHKRLTGWKNRKTGELRMCRPDLLVSMQLAFSGIQVLSQDFLDMMADEGKFSIIETYLNLAMDYDIHGWEHDPLLWLDVGKPDAIKKANPGW